MFPKPSVLRLPSSSLLFTQRPCRLDGRDQQSDEPCLLPRTLAGRRRRGNNAPIGIASHRSECKLPRLCNMPTPRACCTATSSRRTCCSTCRARYGSPTSVLRSWTTTAGLTETGDVLGTLRYMAPEAFQGHADARSEVYSLGLTLYELLAFRPAFERTQRKPLIDQVLNADIEPLAKLNPAIPRDLETIVHKAIERDPQHRYQIAQELDADLQRFIDDEPIKARRISLVERLRRWSRQNKGLAAALSFAASLLLLLALGSAIAAGYLKKSASLARLNEQHAEVNERKARETAAKAQAERDVAQRLSYAATIQLAEAMLSGDDASRFRVADLLWSTQADLRGWEWGHLMAAPEFLALGEVGLGGNRSWSCPPNPKSDTSVSTTAPRC